MKIRRILKKNKMPMFAAAAIVVAGLAGGAYYLSTKQAPKSENKVTTTETAPTTSTEVQQNVQQKGEAATGTATTTSPTVAVKPATVSLADVSLSVFRSDSSADVSLYGPAGKYGIEKLVGSTWTTLIASFDYSGRGGRTIDTIVSSAPETHYRVFLLSNNVRTATSGDTTISWQQLLNNGGTLSVPLAE